MNAMFNKHILERMDIEGDKEISNDNPRNENIVAVRGKNIARANVNTMFNENNE